MQDSVINYSHHAVHYIPGLIFYQRSLWLQSGAPGGRREQGIKLPLSASPGKAQIHHEELGVPTNSHTPATLWNYCHQMFY